MLLVSNFVASQISSAASQGYAPKYSTSDSFLNTADPTSANFDRNQFDGSIGIASLGTMLKASGKAPYPGWEVCSQIATDAKLPPIAPDDPASNESSACATTSSCSSMRSSPRDRIPHGRAGVRP